MKSSFRSWGWTLSALSALLALSLSTAQAAQPLSFSFLQTGFADGAVLSGRLVGEDADGDGYLVNIELSAFELRWSGNRAVAAFDHSMDDRASLYLHLPDLRLEHLATTSFGPDGERLFAYDSYGWPGFDIPGRISDERDQLLSLSWEPVQITAAVPEPHGLPMMLAGLAAVGRLLRRRGRQVPPGATAVS